MSESIPEPSVGRATHTGVQCAALPYRWADGLRILLVTSRETRRWVVPKGWLMKGKTAHAAAAREAMEEAGVVGRIGRTPIGAYRYIKRLKNGAPLECIVDVFPLEVARQLEHWPEQQQRTAHWFAVAEAAAAVDEAGLRDLIEGFGQTITMATV